MTNTTAYMEAAEFVLARDPTAGEQIALNSRVWGLPMALVEEKQVALYYTFEDEEDRFGSARSAVAAGVSPAIAGKAADTAAATARACAMRARIDLRATSEVIVGCPPETTRAAALLNVIDLDQATPLLLFFPRTIAVQGRAEALAHRSIAETDQAPHYSICRKRFPVYRPVGARRSVVASCQAEACRISR